MDAARGRSARRRRRRRPRPCGRDDRGGGRRGGARRARRAAGRVPRAARRARRAGGAVPLAGRRDHRRRVHEGRDRAPGDDARAPVRGRPPDGGQGDDGVRGADATCSATARGCWCRCARTTRRSRGWRPSPGHAARTRSGSMRAPTTRTSPPSATCRSWCRRRSSRRWPGRAHEPRGDWAWAEALAAGGWASMTRLARGDATMDAGIAATNAPADRRPPPRPPGRHRRVAGVARGARRTRRAGAPRAVRGGPGPAPRRRRLMGDPEEQVLVVPRASIVPGDGWLGVRRDGIEAALDAVGRDGFFMRRGDARRIRPTSR